MTAPLLECRGLAVGYDTPVLEHIDLRVEPGEILALLGGSGCGKSTLLRTFTGLLRPLAGEVLLFGQPLHDLSPDDRNRLLRRTGTAFQQDALFGSMTVGDNVALPLRQADVAEPIIREMVAIKLGLVGLAGFERREPASLSGGERKRVALARASILDPDLVFCDEPGAGLDPVVAATIDATLLRFRAAFGMALVVVSHELESIRALADRAVMFAGGAIVARGTIDELAVSKDRVVFDFFHRVAGSPGVRAGNQSR